MRIVAFHSPFASSSASMPQRLSYEDSCKFLQEQQIIEPGEIPPLLARPPRCDDEELGVTFFRTQLADAKLEHLTLSRTFFGRSEIRNVSFCGTDLSESTANWNDFIDVDFRAADLSSCDLRASDFERVRFTNAILRGADLRRCHFVNCEFASAGPLAGAKLTRETAAAIRLSPEQQRSVDWQSEDGDEPAGG